MAADAHVIDMSDLKDLEPLSKRLNAASDELTQILQTIQDRINALGIGLSVWVDSPALIATEYSEVLDRDNEPTGSREYRSFELGYGRHGDGWALLVRERRMVETPDDRIPDIYEDSMPTPLLRASRELRVESVRVIPTLIDKLKSEAARVIGRVEDAKKIADSLK